MGTGVAVCAWLFAIALLSLSALYVYKSFQKVKQLKRKKDEKRDDT